DALLRAAELRSGHELHGLGDLLGRLDGSDPPPDVAQRGHRSSSEGGSAPLPNPPPEIRLRWRSRRSHAGAHTRGGTHAQDPTHCQAALMPRDVMNSALASSIALVSASRRSSVSSFRFAMSGISFAWRRSRNG